MVLVINKVGLEEAQLLILKTLAILLLVLVEDTVVGVGRNSQYCHTKCTPGLEVDPTTMELQCGAHPLPGMEVGPPA